jgi:conjugal transfer mating pair stabilization protein TraG
VARSNRADANLRDQIQFSESVSDAYQRGESISKDLAKDPANIELFERLLRTEQPSSAAELVRLESFLGNISRTPMPITKASRLPSSFDEVRNEYLDAKKDLAATPDVERTFDSFKMQVRGNSGRGSNGQMPELPGAEDGEAVREAIQQKGEELSAKAEAQQNKFDALDVKRTANGHPTTERSLFNSANEQVKSDPDLVAKKMKELMEKIETKWK